MRVNYTTILALLTACLVFGKSHGQYYYGYNNYPSFHRFTSGPNPKRYFSRPNYGLSAGWYRSRDDFWKTKKKMYDYQGMESTAMMSTDTPSIATNPYPTQDSFGVVPSEQAFPSTMPVTQEIQQPIMPQYPETPAVQSEPTAQDLSYPMSMPMAPANQEMTSTVESPVPAQAAPLQPTQQQTTTPPQTMEFEIAKFPQPQSHLLPSSSSKLASKAEFKEHNSSRICNPGPPLKRNPRLWNCLVVGDSIALGYLRAVKFLLGNRCQVQHAPFARGSGAIDSRHGLKCLSLLLKTTAMEPTTYDAILFNFGMHDIDYSKRFPEEHVPFKEYKDNLLKLKQSFLKTGAKVAFALTTPFPTDKKRNDRVKKFNAAAVRVMEGGHRVPVVDLYTIVTKRCGKPAYDSCSIMKGPRDVHYNEEGNQLLGVRVAATFAALLSQGPPKKQPPAKAATRRFFTKRGYADYYIPDDAITCSDAVTRCPIGTTCCESLISLTGYGCCMIPDAINCPDNWHCCPNGSACSPTCNVRECKCVSYVTSGNKTTISQKSKAKVKYLAETNLLDGGRGKQLGKNLKPIVDPLFKVLKILSKARTHQPKKNAKLWRNKLFESKGKLQFKNIKSRKSKSRKTYHKTTVRRLKPQKNSINVELGHLIEHHHKTKYKDLKLSLKSGVTSKGKTSKRVQYKKQHSHLKEQQPKFKGIHKNAFEPTTYKKEKLHPKQHHHLYHLKLTKKPQHHNNLHQELVYHHDHQHKGSDVRLTDAKDGRSKSSGAHKHQHYSSANQKQSFEYRFIPDKKKLMGKSKANSNNDLHVTKTKADKERHDGLVGVGVKSFELSNVKNKVKPLRDHHVSKDDHVSSSENSGSGGENVSGSGLRDISDYDFDKQDASGSGMRDTPSSIDPYHYNGLKENESKSSKSLTTLKIKNAVNDGEYNDVEPKYSTIESSKKTSNNTSIESKSLTSHRKTSGSGTPLLNVLLSDSHRGNALRDSFDDIDPGDGHTTRDPFQDGETSGTSGEFLGQNLGEIVEDNDGRGFDLMSNALMDNDGAKNTIIKEEQGVEKPQNSASGDQHGELVGNINKAVSKLGSKRTYEKSSFIDGEGSDDDDDDDDIRGESDGMKLSAEHRINKSIMEYAGRTEDDLNDRNHFVALDSLLGDITGKSDETQSKSTKSSTAGGPNDALQGIPLVGPKIYLVEKPVKSSVPGDQNKTLQRTPLMVTKTELEENPVENPVENPATGDRDKALQRAPLMGPQTDLVENPVATGSINDVSNGTVMMERKTKMTKSSMDNSKHQLRGTPEVMASMKSDKKLQKSQRKEKSTMNVFHGIQDNQTTISYTKKRKFNHENLEHHKEKVSIKKLKNGKIHIHRTLLKKKTESGKVTKKTFVGKKPISIINKNFKNRQNVYLQNQEYTNKKNGSSLVLKSSSKGYRTIERARSSSLRVTEKKDNYAGKKKLFKTKDSRNSRQFGLGEDDDIGGENSDIDQASLSQRESARGTLEEYLAMP